MDMFYHLHKEQNSTTILVTHSMEDALKYADHVMILNEGKLYVEGKPEEVFIQKERLQQVDLDVPEVIEFLQQFERKMGIKIPYQGQSIYEITHYIQHVIMRDVTVSNLSTLVHYIL